MSGTGESKTTRRRFMRWVTAATFSTIATKSGLGRAASATVAGTPTYVLPKIQSAPAFLTSLSTPNTTATARSATVSPPTTPFIEALKIAPTKEAIPSLSPIPMEATSEGEFPRVNHQRWTEFLPKKLYELRVRQGQHRFHPELPTQTIWGYDGITPGPTFMARYNEPILVRIHNELPLAGQHIGFGSPEISTHLHNSHSASESDGFAEDFFASGYFKDHHYPNAYPGYDTFQNPDETRGDKNEALGTLWYHDHRADFTAANVYRGLAGFYLLFDELDSGDENDSNPVALRLPGGEFDVPLMFSDKTFKADGTAFFDQLDTEGILGDKFLVNGTIQPYFKVARRKYRFRMLDASPTRFYEFWLRRGENGPFMPFDYYIANDGNLLPAPITNMQSVRLAPAERGDVVVDFSKFNLGERIYLFNRLEQKNGRGPTGELLAPGTPLLRFDIEHDVANDPSQIPASLRPLSTFKTAEAVKRRTWKFDRNNGQWAINNMLYDPDVARAAVKRGTAEIWEFTNGGGWFHPVHIHFEEARILSRNGKAPPKHEQGRKDVFVVAPGETVRIFIRFRDFVGKHLMHCHNSVHEDHAMMLRFDIVP